ncbi:exportin-5 isoform X1 [Hydra vulgaris]|nr:exportin-5 [Hydra vulgaris]
MELNSSFLNEADIINSLANEIKNSIDVTFSQTSSKSEREDAYKVFEKTKYIEPQYDKVFSFLYHRNFSINIRVCSLHLFDQYIKTKWKDFSNDKKEQLKVEAMSLIKQCDFDEPLCLKEATVKVIVEIIKRTWPQYWSSLLSDLYKLQEFGPAQLELVLIIFKRLFEDLNGSDDYLTSQRKKDMLSTLDSSIGMLFGFFLTSLNQYIVFLNEQLNNINNQVADAALDAILTFVTWVNLEHLFFQDKLLFKSLFVLLKYDYLKFKGCCCLQAIFERKGYSHQKLDLLSTMDINDLNILHEAARKSNELAIQNNEEYMFLKKLIETLSIFGRCHIADNTSNNHFEVELLNSYIKLMLQFSMHDSIIISLAATKVWNSFLHHDVIKNNPVFIACIPDILECSYRNLDCDSGLNNSRSIFIKIDFEDIEEFSSTFADVHCSMIELSKSITSFYPILALHMCESKIKIATSVLPPVIKDLSAEALTTYITSWDSLSVFSRKGFASVFFKNSKNIDSNSTAVCNSILKLLIEYNCEIPQLVSHVITTIEAFFPLFHYSQTNLLPVFNLIFAILGKPLDNPVIVKLKNVASKTFKNLCQEIKTILIPYFNDLQVYFNLQFSIFQQSVLTNYHKNLLIEGLLVVCAVLDDSVCKKEFIDKLFGFVFQVFKRSDIQSIYQSPESLLSFLELDKPASLTDEISPTHKEFSLAYIIVLSVSRTLNVCNQINDNDNYFDGSQHVWLQHMINCIPYLFDFAKQYCFLWSLKDRIAPSKSHYLDICTVEYSSTVVNNLGNDHDDYNPTSDYMQYYIYNLNEFTYTILSHLPTCVGPELYNLPGLSDLLVEKLAIPCAHLPNYRIKKVWKSFMRRFIICCPTNRLRILGPFLGTSLQIMSKRLSSGWERIENRSSGYEQINEETMVVQSNKINEKQKREIIDDKVMSTLSKEFIDTLFLYCTYKGENKKQVIPDDSISIGVIGDFLLSYQETNFTLIYIFFSALTWPDSSSLVKICSVIMPIIKKTFALYGSINPVIPRQLLIHLLTGLQKHGMEVHSEAALSNTIYYYYTHLRMQYPNLAEVLVQIPTCSFQKLKELDSEIDNENKSKAKFRKLIKGACGKSLSRTFVNQYFYEELPPLARREKNDNSIFYENDPLVLCTLFGDDDNK